MADLSDTLVLNDPALSAKLRLQWSPVVDAKFQVLGTRLTLALARPEVVPEGAAVLAWLASVRPVAAPKDKAPAMPITRTVGAGASRAAGVVPGTVLLSAAGEPLWRALLAAAPKPPFALEVPAFLLAERQTLAAVVAAQRAGCVMWLRGRLPELAEPAWWGLFQHVLVDVPDAPPAHRGACGAVASGVIDRAQFNQALHQGCTAVAGWPFADAPDDRLLAGARAPGAPAGKVAPELQLVMDLMARVDREEPIERLEAAMKGDPTLVFRLLRYLNSPAFGMAVEIGSLRHAIMLLGYAKLKRWLALLLASASREPQLRPLMHTAVRRGLMMEELARGLDDAQFRSDLFICGVFSLLDRMLGQSFAALFANVLVPQPVFQALVDGCGPLRPYLDLVQATEAGGTSGGDARACMDAVLLTPAEVNRALLQALHNAASLD
jgi:c-di-GMP phosphodiesterase